MSEISSPSTASEVEEVVSHEELMSRANASKESGNTSFKASDFNTAITHYEEALKSLEKVPTDFEGCKSLKSVLYSNLSASYLGISEPVKAISSANDALKWDSGNKKAQYRRALARFNAGYLEEAKSDCINMISEDKDNSNARMLLAKVNQKIKLSNEMQKKAFGSLFEKVGGLYEDRAAEMHNKKQRKYEDYTREQREKGEEELDFEAWELKEAEEEKKREAERIEKVKEEERKREAKNMEKAKDSKKDDQESSKDQSDSTTADAKKTGAEESDMDEEDQKIIQETKKMGYCYFGKNKPEGNLTHAPVPQKIETATPNVTQSVTRSISSWNSKGTTYEEKDMSSWCKQALRETLSQAMYENNPKQNGPPVNIVEMFKDINIDKIDDKDNLEKLQKLAMAVYKSSIKVVSVEDLECDAQIALIRATRRYMFDFSCSLNLRISIDTDVGSLLKSEEDSDDSTASVYEGVLKLSEISSEMEKGKTYSDYMKASYKDTIKSDHVELVRCMIDQFKSIVSDRIHDFLEKYKMQ